MAMSNNIGGGPNFNPGIARLPNPASGAPAAEPGAQFHTGDAVSLGQTGNLQGNPSTFTRSTPAGDSGATLSAPGNQSPTVNNAPTVLTIGSLSETTPPGPQDVVMNGLGRPCIEGFGRLDLSADRNVEVRAGVRPYEN